MIRLDGDIKSSRHFSKTRNYLTPNANVGSDRRCCVAHQCDVIRALGIRHSRQNDLTVGWIMA